MSTYFSADHIAAFFAIVPWIFAIAIFVAAYLMTRGERSHTAPVGRTFVCANCGRRGVREHMVPQPHEGAVLWYCSHCSGGH